MDTRTQILSSAERLFDRHGFTATGMDQVIQAAEVSSRTLYKHVGGKGALIVAVLEARQKRFFERCDVESVDALFGALEDWTSHEGARGCLFLRAQGDAGGLPSVKEAVASYRDRLRERVSRVIAKDIGTGPSRSLVDQVLLLLEGATSAATYQGPAAMGNARMMAALLIEHAHGSPRPPCRGG